MTDRRVGRKRGADLERRPENVYGPLGSKDRRRNLQKASVLETSYGLTLEAYRRMHDAQNGLCAICGQPETGVHNRGKKTVALSLSVDHDHETGAVRALLCHKCNKALGLLNDDLDLLVAAEQYLRAHKGG